MTWIKGACGDSAFDGGGEAFDISSEEYKQNVTSDGRKRYMQENYAENDSSNIRALCGTGRREDN
jgi:hypothetical protein